MLNHAEDFKGVTKVIVPGVGQIKSVMNEIEGRGLRQPIILAAQERKWILGICLGMQALGLKSDEDDKTITLGLLNFHVEKINKFSNNKNLRVPHVGWNSVKIKSKHPLFEGIVDGSDFYFANSFCVYSSEDSIAETDHGRQFSSVVARERVLGVQFHPERSQSNGKKLLSNFAEMV